MTKQQALADWRRTIRPGVVARHGEHDLAALRESWQVYTDQLCKAGRITLRQYETWGNPPGTE